jgi:hypothetical protein
LIALVFFLLVIIADVLYHEPLFNASLTFIPDIQGATSEAGLNFWHFYTDFGLISMPVIAVGGTYLLGPS